MCDDNDGVELEATAAAAVAMLLEGLPPMKKRMCRLRRQAGGRHADVEFFAVGSRWRQPPVSKLRLTGTTGTDSAACNLGIRCRRRSVVHDFVG